MSTDRRALSVAANSLIPRMNPRIVFESVSNAIFHPRLFSIAGQGPYDRCLRPQPTASTGGAPLSVVSRPFAKTPSTASVPFPYGAPLALNPQGPVRPRTVRRAPRRLSHRPKLGALSSSTPTVEPILRHPGSSYVVYSRASFALHRLAPTEEV
jgi:hypothetical protein